MLMCLIAFVLGYIVSRMMRGNGLMVGGQQFQGKWIGINEQMDTCMNQEPNNYEVCHSVGRYLRGNYQYDDQICTNRYFSGTTPQERKAEADIIYNKYYRDVAQDNGSFLNKTC
jgi:hypothetical protein